MLQRFITSLYNEFSMTDFGPSHYFLGISVSRDVTRMFLVQRKHALEILEHASMLNCQSCRTPVDIESKLDADGPPVSNPTLYRSITDALQYLTFMRPDLSYAVQQICLCMHDPREPHQAALKRILLYVRGCTTTRRSTSSYCVFLGNNLLSCSSKSHATLSRSSAEAEYRDVANVVSETAWLRNLLRELHSPLQCTTLVYCDNVSVVYMSSNPVQHQCTKHVEIDIHIISDQVAAWNVRVLHARYQFADIFTKGLPYALFDDNRSSLSVRPSPALNARNYKNKNMVAAELVHLEDEHKAIKEKSSILYQQIKSEIPEA
ncbi:ribonuclease H-like domain-containing protein [Tanacetum coccineum]